MLCFPLIYFEMLFFHNNYFGISKTEVVWWRETMQAVSLLEKCLKHELVFGPWRRASRRRPPGLLGP